MTVGLELPDSVLQATGQSADEFAREARLLLALKLFEMARISSGQASELSGLSRVEFLFGAGRAGVPVADLDQHEMTREFTDALAPSVRIR